MNRNVMHALLSILRQIEDEGRIVVARGQEQKEVLSTLTKIARPTERFLVLPGRRNNVFAQVAETAWVLAGRNDLEFLKHYLPRAVDFSDDGTTWRAGYGPRLRKWDGRIDQLSEVQDRLLEDPTTKRAVISIYDPGSDFGDTKDVPCNNWLQFIQRDGVLDLHVAVRANDAVWGFSGINFFEWSVLLEIAAHSLGWKVGTLSWYVGTFHVYERHYDLAHHLLQLENPPTPYEVGIEPTPIWATLDNLGSILNDFFAAEDHARSGRFDDAKLIGDRIPDPFFRSAATLMRIYNAQLHGVDHKTILMYLHELGDSDFFTAAIEFIARQWKDTSVLNSLTGRQGEFFERYDMARLGAMSRTRT